MKLFDTDESRERLRRAEPLAVRMRPRSIDEFVGQEHFIGKGKLLWRMLKADRLSSLIFYGPPGTGKTALAHVIAGTTHATFLELNASASGVGEVREAIADARTRLESTGGRTVLFVDELHRFNRAQQDVLLPDVERGIVILIGATTLNPFFSINSPLISRSQIFEFKPLSPDDIRTVMRRALADEEHGLGKLDVRITDDALDFLAEVSDGDARRALNAIEIGVFSQTLRKNKPVKYDLAIAQESIQRKALVYDGTGDEHYDAASAFIKSMRGSDPDAALYWMARMLEAGEDPRFVARRMVICASEDVGNANPQALVVATAALQAVEFVGMPEAQIPLAQAVTYIACSPKSNAAYLGIAEAMKDVREGRTVAVPDPLKDANYPGAKRLGRGEGYQYAHDFEGHWVDQDYLGVDREYYRPTEEGFEAKIKERLDRIRQSRKKRPPGKEERGES
ncbi:MAG TPA: replication-associated recombination protein A [Planctomycetota bacterium]|nr:replication-associated recombination protein A [Planctomycetota bacterium]